MWSRGENRGKNIPGSWNISQKRVTKGCTEGHHSFGLRVAAGWKSLPVEIKNVASLRDGMLRLERERGKKRGKKTAQEIGRWPDQQEPAIVGMICPLSLNSSTCRDWDYRPRPNISQI
jgi:hypothetical protein